MINKFSVVKDISNLEELWTNHIESGIYSTKIPERLNMTVLENNTDSATIAVYFDKGLIDMNIHKDIIHVADGSAFEFNALEVDKDLALKAPLSSDVYEDIITLGMSNIEHLKKLMPLIGENTDESHIRRHIRAYIDAVYHPLLPHSYIQLAAEKLGLDELHDVNDADRTKLNDLDGQTSHEPNEKKFTKRFHYYILYYLILKYVNEAHYINSMDPDLLKSLDDPTLRHRYNIPFDRVLIGSGNILHNKNRNLREMYTLLVEEFTRNPYSDEYLYDNWQPAHQDRSDSVVFPVFETSGINYWSGAWFSSEIWKYINCNVRNDRSKGGLVKLGMMYDSPWGVRHNRNYVCISHVTPFSMYNNIMWSPYEIKSIDREKKRVKTTKLRVDMDNHMEILYDKYFKNSSVDLEDEWDFHDRRGTHLSSKKSVILHYNKPHEFIPYTKKDILDFYAIDRKNSTLAAFRGMDSPELLDFVRFTDYIGNKQPYFLTGLYDVCTNHFEGDSKYYEESGVINKYAPYGNEKGGIQDIFNSLMSDQNYVSYGIDKGVQKIAVRNFIQTPNDGLPNHIRVVYHPTEGDPSNPNYNRKDDYDLIGNENNLLPLNLEPYAIRPVGGANRSEWGKIDNKAYGYTAYYQTKNNRPILLKDMHPLVAVTGSLWYEQNNPNNYPEDYHDVYESQYKNEDVGYSTDALARRLWKLNNWYHINRAYSNGGLFVYPPHKTLYDNNDPKENRYFYTRPWILGDPTDLEHIGAISEQQTDNVIFMHAGHSKTPHMTLKYMVDPTIYDRGIVTYNNLYTFYMPVLPRHVVDNIKYLTNYMQKNKMASWLSDENYNLYLDRKEAFSREHSSKKYLNNIEFISKNNVINKLIKDINIIDKYLPNISTYLNDEINAGNIKIYQNTTNSDMSSILTIKINKKKNRPYVNKIIDLLREGNYGDIKLLDITQNTTYNDIVNVLTNKLITNDIGDDFDIISNVYKTLADSEKITTHNLDKNLIYVKSRNGQSVDIQRLYTNNNLASDTPGLLSREIITNLVDDISKKNSSEFFKRQGIDFQNFENNTIDRDLYKNYISSDNLDNLVLRNTVKSKVLVDNISQPIIITDNKRVLDYSGQETWFGNVMNNSNNKIFLLSTDVYSVINNADGSINTTDDIKKHAIKNIDMSNKWKIINISIVDRSTSDSVFNHQLDHQKCDGGTYLYFRADDTKSADLHPTNPAYNYHYISSDGDEEYPFKKLSANVKKQYTDRYKKPLVRSYVLDKKLVFNEFKDVKELKVELFLNGKLLQTIFFNHKEIETERIAYFNINNGYGDINFLAFGIEKLCTNFDGSGEVKYAIIKNTNMVINDVDYIYTFKIYWR